MGREGQGRSDRETGRSETERGERVSSRGRRGALPEKLGWGSEKNCVERCQRWLPRRPWRYPARSTAVNKLPVPALESTWRVADATEGNRRFGKSTRCREDASRRRSGTPRAIRFRMQHPRPGPRGVRTPCYPRRPVVFPGAPGSRDYRNPLRAHGAVLPVQRRTCPRVP